jgi:hypothetical protein
VTTNTHAVIGGTVRDGYLYSVRPEVIKGDALLIRIHEGEWVISSSRVEAGSNTSTVAQRVVEGDEKGTQCLGVKLGHPVPGGYKYGDLALQVGGVSNPRQ